MPFNPQDYSDRLLIADGDWRVEFANRDVPASQGLARVSLTKPDIVSEVAQVFLAAGSEILVTPTAVANRVTLSDEIAAGTVRADELGAMNRQYAALCRQAVSNHPASPRLVFGSIGPTEKLLVLDEIDETALTDAYLIQALALAAGGSDAILCRSFREMDALLIAVRAARRTGLPVIASMVFDCGADFTETSLGASVPQACEALKQADVAALGCEGGESPDSLPGVVTAIRRAWNGPVWVAIPAGTPQWIEGKVVYAERPDDFASRLAPLRKAGANFVAGDRGVTAAHIRALAKARKSR